MDVDWSAADAEVARLRAAELWNPPACTAMQVLGTQRREIPHSRMLGWLLDPTASHGLGLRMLTAFLRRLGHGELTDGLGAEHVRVERELVLEGQEDHQDRRADIVVRAGGTPVVIELKVDAAEGTDQTRDLAGHFRRLHPAPILVFLTLDGTDAEEPAFLSMRLRDVALDLRAALATAPEPAGAAGTVGRRTAADYLETLGTLTRTNATARAAARFWLRHGDDRAYAEARAAAWTVLGELPERTARILGERCATDDLRVTIRTETVRGRRHPRRDRVVLLSRRRWLDERGEPTAGIGVAVRRHDHPDDDRWLPRNMPYYGIWIAAPVPRRPLLARPRHDQPWGDWGVDWDHLPLSLDDTDPAADPVDVYATRAADLVQALWAAHSADIDAVVATSAARAAAPVPRDPGTAGHPEARPS